MEASHTLYVEINGVDFSKDFYVLRQSAFNRYEIKGTVPEAALPGMMPKITKYRLDTARILLDGKVAKINTTSCIVDPAPAVVKQTTVQAEITLLP
jgi:hypothetical protein